MPRRSQKLIIYALILVVPLSLLFLSHKVLTSPKMILVESTLTPLKIILFPFRELKKIVFYRYAYRKYAEMKDLADTLKRRLIDQEEIIRENNRFRKLLDFKESLVFSSVAANVIGRSPTNWNAIVIIDRGEKDGLKQGLPVVTALGIVGKISEVGKTSSKVLLVSDPNFSVPAIIKRNHEGGLLSGTLQGLLRMRYLSQDSDIRTGDRVITSKLSSSFPEGLLIGEVVSVDESQSTPTIECLVEPAVLLSQTEEVIIIFK